MKRLILALILLASTISFIGCGDGDAQILITEALKDAPDTLLLYPPKILISGVAPGSTIKAPSLMLQNGLGHDITLNLYLESPPTQTLDADTGLTYHPAPPSYAQWINNPHNYEFINLNILHDLKIPAYSIASIPIQITIPKNILAPDRWEFDIKVSEPGGFITTALIQRWLMTMEH